MPKTCKIEDGNAFSDESARKRIKVRKTEINRDGLLTVKFSKDLDFPDNFVDLVNIQKNQTGPG